MPTQLNPPSSAEAERLTMLIEECGEVIQAATKILRHGWDNYHPGAPETSNTELLELELLDLKAVVWAMQQDGDLAGEPGYSMLEDTWLHKLRYTHHQGAAE